MMDSQQTRSPLTVRGQSFDRNSSTSSNRSTSIQDRLKVIRQQHRKKRIRERSPLSNNKDQLSYLPAKTTQPYSKETQQNNSARQPVSLGYQNSNGNVAQNPLANPVVTPVSQNDDRIQHNFGSGGTSGDTGFVPVPPVSAPPAETPGTLNNPESVLNNPQNLAGSNGLSLVPSGQNSETTGHPGFGTSLNPDVNLLVDPFSGAEPDGSPFLEKMKHFYLDRGLIPQSSSASMMVMAGSTDDIGFFEWYLQTTFAVESVPGLTLAPSFQVDFLNGPTRTDLPPQLFNLGVELRMAKPLTERTSYELAVRPAVFSDFEAGGSAAARVTGRGIGFYTWSQQTQLVFGLVFLGRKDVPLLPVIGVIHIPRGDWRLELVFPRPRILKLISHDNEKEKWGYLSGEFGGGSWAVARPGRPNDVATLSDLRLILGFENRYANGRSWYFEVGLVFDRQLEFETGPGDFDPDTTGMIRAGIVY